MTDRRPEASRRLPGRSRGLRTALVATLVCSPLAAVPVSAQARVAPASAGQAGPPGRSDAKVLPSLRRNLVAYYDFKHPVPGDPGAERDQGFGRTNINLVNGGAAMRVRDGAFPGSRYSIQTKQVNPTVTGNDDFPQNTEEKNPCDCRMDTLMFLDRVVTPQEVRRQYRQAVTRRR
jgi:hypothetical protein